MPHDHDDDHHDHDYHIDDHDKHDDHNVDDNDNDDDHHHDHYFPALLHFRHLPSRHRKREVSQAWRHLPLVHSSLAVRTAGYLTPSASTCASFQVSPLRTIITCLVVLSPSRTVVSSTAA